MNARTSTSRWARAAGATLGTGALLVTVGCGTPDLNAVSAHAQSAGQTGAPVVVSCEPHQRTIVRPVVVNGVAMSQVECVATGQVPVAQPLVAQPQMAPAQPVYREVRAAQPVHAGDLGDARVVPAVYPSSGAARPAPARQVIYREPEKQNRSVKKSAVIVGSSAGVGAGVGAAVGGKKGALIGAAIGGGSAAIWDQVTRRND